MYIYSNKFFHNFHMSESSFTCPGLRESVLAWRLILIYFSRTIGTKHDRDVNTVVINNLHHFTYILSFYHFFTYILSFYHFTYILHTIYIIFVSFWFIMSWNVYDFFLSFFEIHNKNEFHIFNIECTCTN
jgi:hypothetical protein